MTTNELVLIVLSTIVCLAMLLSVRYKHLRRNYYLGISIWGRWLPVAATGIYLATLAVNLAPAAQIREHALSLTSIFSATEILALFLAGALFLSRLGNIVAAAAVAYCLERLLGDAGTGSIPVGLFLLSGAATVVAILGDKMPWRAAAGPHYLLDRLREMTRIALAIGSLGVTVMGMIKVYSFAPWVEANFAITLPIPVFLAVMLIIFIGWLTVALDMVRHLTIPVLGLPTLLILAYVTAWPSALLIIPFSLYLSLALATSDRRARGVRRNTGFNSTVLLSR